MGKPLFSKLSSTQKDKARNHWLVDKRIWDYMKKAYADEINEYDVEGFEI